MEKLTRCCWIEYSQKCLCWKQSYNSSSWIKQVLEVPEWNLVGEDAIYVKPFTLIEKDEIFKGTSDNSLTVLIDVIVKKALTKDGDKMFDLEAKIKMKRFVDPDILSKVASQILGTGQDPTTIKKN